MFLRQRNNLTNGNLKDTDHRRITCEQDGLPLTSRSNTDNGPHPYHAGPDLARREESRVTCHGTPSSPCQNRLSRWSGRLGWVRVPLSSSPRPPSSCCPFEQDQDRTYPPSWAFCTGHTIPSGQNWIGRTLLPQQNLGRTYSHPPYCEQNHTDE